MLRLSKVKRNELRSLRESSLASPGKETVQISSFAKYLMEWAWNVSSRFILHGLIKSKWFRAAECGAQSFITCGEDQERRLGSFPTNDPAAVRQSFRARPLSSLDHQRS